MNKPVTPAELTPVHEIPTVCIMGDPGAGKTRLASLWPDPFFLDAERGAASAVPPERRKSFNISNALLEELKAEVNVFLKLPYKDKRLMLNGMPVGGLVIDSLDAIQQVHKYEKVQLTVKDPRRMWGALLDDMIKLVYLTKRLPIPVIWIAHIKSDKPVIDDDGTVKQRGWRGIATQGAIEEQILRWFDYALHLVVEEDFRRRCFTQPTVWNNYKLTAKDRHYTFASINQRSFIVEVNEMTGFPVTKALTTIYERHIY